MTANDTNDDDREKDTVQVKTPREAKTILKPSGGFSMEMRGHRDATDIEVMGTVKPDSFIPSVTLKFEARAGNRDDYFLKFFSLEEARDLAETLESQADHAERYSEHKKEEYDWDS